MTRGALARRVAVVAALLVDATAARAEPTDQDKATATALFNEGRQLLGDGRIAEACRRLEESRRLDPLPGTLLNLAVCHQLEGLTASAWAEFREARVLAERDGRADRVALADEHMKQLEPRLSWLVIDVADPPEGLRVVRDGTVLGSGAWGTRIPVDPGEHVVQAEAPGKKAWRLAATVKSDGDVVRVAVGPFEDDAAPPPPVTAPPPPPSVSPPSSDVPAEHPALSTRRKIAVASAGFGVVALGAGAFFGIRAIGKHDDPDATCTTTPCSSASVSLNDQAKSAADISTVSFVVAIAALGAGAFLWFGDADGSPRVTLAPGGVLATKRF